MTQDMGQGKTFKSRGRVLSLPDDIEVKIFSWSGMYQLRVLAKWSQAVPYNVPSLLDGILIAFYSDIPRIFTLGDEITLYTRS